MIKYTTTNTACTSSYNNKSWTANTAVISNTKTITRVFLHRKQDFWCTFWRFFPQRKWRLQLGTLQTRLTSQPSPGLDGSFHPGAGFIRTAQHNPRTIRKNRQLHKSVTRSWRLWRAFAEKCTSSQKVKHRWEKLPLIRRSWSRGL